MTDILANSMFEFPHLFFFQGGFQLYISVVDEDVDIDDHVDDIFVDITLSPSTSFTPVQTFTGIYNNSMVELSFRVTCLVADTGTCEVDNPLTCEDGWTDPANGCRTRELIDS